MGYLKNKLFSYATIAISSAITGVLVSARTLPGSYGTGCAFGSKKIYCYGGSIQAEGYGSYTPTTNFFSLDVSGPITTADNSSSWQTPVSSGDIFPTPNMFFGIAALPGGDGFVISGGIGYNNGNSLSYPIMMYNTTNGTWATIETTFPQTSMNALATDYKNGNQVFMYGGQSTQSTGYQNTSQYEAYPPQGILLTYQNTRFNWAIGPELLLASGMASGRIRHSAVQGADGKFYIIGGEFSQYTVNATNVPQVSYLLSPATMNEVLVYDIGTGWKTVATNGASPSSRWHHTSTLISSGKILILGGCRTNYYATNDSLSYMVPSSDYAFTLDTNTMTWVDQTSAIQPAPNSPVDSTQEVPRCLHQSVLIGKDSLFVLLGRSDKGNFANPFLILNTTSWVLTNSFPGLDPPVTTTTESNRPGTTNTPGAGNATEGAGQQSSTLSGGAIAGIVVGAVVGVALIIIAGFLYQRKSKGSANQYTEHQSEKPERLDIDSANGDAYTSPTTVTGSNGVSVDSLYGKAIKPEGNNDTYSFGGGSQRIVMTPVKPDGE